MINSENIKSKSSAVENPKESFLGHLTGSATDNLTDHVIDSPAKRWVISERIIIDEKPINNSDIDSGKTFSLPDHQLGEIFHRGGPTRRSGFKLAAWVLASFAVDALIIVAAMLSFIVISALLTKYVMPKDMINLINQKNLVQTMIYASVFMGWIYYLFMRMFFGATVGEMSCALRVGQPYERAQPFYMLRVLSRLVVISLTGFIVLPLLSILLRKDVAGYISKISLYSLK